MSISKKDEYTHDIFLSYSSHQRDWVLDLARKLRDQGFKVWFDVWSLRPGGNWVDGLAQGVKASKKLVAVISPEYVNGEWTTFEEHIAILGDPSARKGRIIPIIHTKENIPDELAVRQALDFSDTHNDSLKYNFCLDRLMASIDTSREYPEDFEQYCKDKAKSISYEMPPKSSLPQGSVMPYSDNKNFVGRENELKWLYNNLKAGADVSLGQTAVATGLGGIGKSQLAVEFAYRYGKNYDGGVFWLDMSDAEGVANQIAEFASPKAMDIQGYGKLPQGQIVDIIIKEWHGQRNRLLIFDNVEDIKVVDKWKSKSGRTRVLITTRIDSHDSRWGDRGIETLPIDTLPRDKSLELLCRQRKDALDDPDQRKVADEICELLGDLPLAIHIAGSYLNHYRESLQEYLDELKAQSVHDNPVLIDPKDDDSPTGHIHSVAITFMTSYQKLNQDDEKDLLSAKVFHLTAHFAPVAISRELLMRSLKMTDKKKLADAIYRLCELGLVQESGDNRIIVHRLLREFALAHTAKGQDANESAEDVAEAMAGYANEVDNSGLPTLGIDLEHLRYIAGEAEKRRSEIAGVLYNNLGYYLHNMIADYKGAMEYFERALTIDEKALGKDHPQVAIRVNNIGSVLWNMGNLQGAKECFERALRIDEKTYEKEHPNIAYSYNNIGMVLQDMGDLQGAMKYYERALTIDEKIYGEEHPNVARDVNNIGGVLHDMGDLQGAKEYFERALGIFEKILGTEHPTTQTIRRNLEICMEEIRRAR